jgi:hypothetical protein
MILPLMILPKMRRFGNPVFFAESLLGGVAGALLFRQNYFRQNDYSLCLLGWALFWVVLCGSPCLQRLRVVNQITVPWLRRCWNDSAFNDSA